MRGEWMSCGEGTQRCGALFFPALADSFLEGSGTCWSVQRLRAVQKVQAASQPLSSGEVTFLARLPRGSGDLWGL